MMGVGRGCTYDMILRGFWPPLHSMTCEVEKTGYVIYVIQKFFVWSSKMT